MNKDHKGNGYILTNKSGQSYTQTEDQKNHPQRIGVDFSKCNTYPVVALGWLTKKKEKR